MKKRMVALLMTGVMLTGALTGCGGNAQSASTSEVAEQTEEAKEESKDAKGEETNDLIAAYASYETTEGEELFLETASN